MTKVRYRVLTEEGSSDVALHFREVTRFVQAVWMT